MLLARRGLGHLRDERLRRSRGVARVGLQQRPLAQAMHADALGVGAASSRPAALAIRGLMAALPAHEQLAQVEEDLLVDLLRDLLRGAASRQRRAARHEVDRGRRALLHDLHVARQQPEPPLRRLIPAEAQDARAARHSKRRDALAGDRHLAAHLLQLPLARLRHDGVGRIDAQHLGDVGVDRGRRRAARQLAPLHRPQPPVLRAEAPALVTARVLHRRGRLVLLRLVVRLALCHFVELGLQREHPSLGQLRPLEPLLAQRGGVLLVSCPCARLLQLLAHHLQALAPVGDRFGDLSLDRRLERRLELALRSTIRLLLDLLDLDGCGSTLGLPHLAHFCPNRGAPCLRLLPAVARAGFALLRRLALGRLLLRHLLRQRQLLLHRHAGGGVTAALLAQLCTVPPDERRHLDDGVLEARPSVALGVLGAQHFAVRAELPVQLCVPQPIVATGAPPPLHRCADAVERRTRPL